MVDEIIPPKLGSILLYPTKNQGPFFHCSKGLRDRNHQLYITGVPVRDGFLPRPGSWVSLGFDMVQESGKKRKDAS